MSPGAHIQRRGGTGERILAWALAAACIAAMAWMGLGWDTLRLRDTYLGRKGDYYSQEVHGFLSGHLYLNKTADFRRDSPDPAVRAQGLYLLDASYYKGRYYLYFGVTPVVLILLPYAWLTGGDLEPRVAVVLCAAIGFLYGFGVLRMAARDRLGRLGGWFHAVAVPVLAGAAAVPMMLTRASFYEVAVSTGYACSMGGVFWLYRALFRRGAPAALALASLNFGLAVGCRPDLVLNLPVLAAAAVLVAGWGRDHVPWRRTLVWTGTAAVLPAALIGAGLAAYNYERFGNPLEFGMSYSINNFIGNHNRLFGAAYLWPNLHWYYLTLPALSPYFPFVLPEQAYFGPPSYPGGEAMHGQFPVLVLALFVGLSALAVGRRLALGRLGAYLGLLAWMFLALLAALCAIGVRADRYAVDFEAPLVLGIVLLAGAVAGAAGDGLGRRLWIGAFAVLGLFACAFNGFGGLQEFETFKNIRTPTYLALERPGNLPSAWLHKLGVLHSGPVELKVVFPVDVPARAIEPLLTAGTPEYSDTLYAIEWPGGRQIELMGDHHGYGGPSSGVIPINPGQAYTLKIDMGALYPPLRHPYFAGYTTLQSRLVKTGLHVEMDGKTVMDARMDSYDAPPWAVEAGRNDVSMSPRRATFSGQIVSERRLEPAQPLALENTGLWRLRCALPMKDVGSSYPVFCSGNTGSGTLIYLSVLPGNHVRFGLDQWGAGGSVSDLLTPAPLSEHRIEIFIGSIAEKTAWPGSWGISWEGLDRMGNSLGIWLDGRLVWRTETQRPLDPRDPQVDVGSNLQGFSTASAEFPGFIRNDPYSDGEARAFLGRNVAQGENGLWRVRSAFPLQRAGSTYPLVSSGVRGAGTLVYLEVLPGNQVRFGVDEWGLGGGRSEAIDSEPGADHVVEILDGALAAKTAWPPSWGIPPAKLDALGHRLSVWLDGRRVWSTDLKRPPGASDSRIAVGANPQGFSTAPGEFPGPIEYDPYSVGAARDFLDRNLETQQ